MPNPLEPVISKLAGPYAGLRLKRFVVGLAQDFWKDGTEHPLDMFKKSDLKTKEGKKAAPSKNGEPTHAEQRATPAAAKEWHAEPGEISEKMWGAGYVTPGDAVVTEMLIQPLGLNKNMSVLDLSAGLGGRLRQTTEKFGVYITGLEPDPQIAARGMALSIKAGKGKHAAIAAYDPANFSVDRRYDCIIARETFYRVANRHQFLEALGTCTKSGAQVSFTDYVVNPEDREKPAIAEWIKSEPGSNPVGLVEIAQEWAKVGFNLRVHDDQTAYYKAEVLAGLKRLAVFLARNPKPDAETKSGLRRRLNSWMLRLGAMEQGMKFYRFYGTKH